MLPAPARMALQPKTTYKDIDIRFTARSHFVGDRTGTSAWLVLHHRTVQGQNSGLDATTIKPTSVGSTPIGSKMSCSTRKYMTAKSVVVTDTSQVRECETGRRGNRVRLCFRTVADRSARATLSAGPVQPNGARAAQPFASAR